MAKFDLVPPELAFESPSFKDICNKFIEKMESCSDVEYHCRMFLKICSNFGGSRIAIVGRDIQRDLRSEGVIINIWTGTKTIQHYSAVWCVLTSVSITILHNAFSTLFYSMNYYLGFDIFIVKGFVAMQLIEIDLF